MLDLKSYLRLIIRRLKMYSLLDGVYDSFTELMYYFYFEYTIYCILLIIMALICIKMISNYLAIKNNPSSNITIHPLDIAISILIGIAFYSSLMFQGVLSDISTEQSNIWFPRVLALCLIYIILFIFQCILLKSIAKYKNEDKD